VYLIFLHTTFSLSACFMEADVFSVNTECQVFACSRLKIVNYFPHCLAAVHNKLHLDHEVELELRLVSVPTTFLMYFSPGIE